MDLERQRNLVGRLHGEDIMKSPNAPISAVNEILKTFKGVECPFKTSKDQWLITFNDRDGFESAMPLINMLQGFKAEAHPDVKNTIQIFDV